MLLEKSFFYNIISSIINQISMDYFRSSQRLNYMYLNSKLLIISL